MQNHTKEKYYLGVDIGGSHFATGIVDTNTMQLLLDTVDRYPVDSTLPAKVILSQLLLSIKGSIKRFAKPVVGLGISIPGPLDYEKGISLISGLNKYERLFGVNLKLFLQSNLKDVIEDTTQIAFLNDANSFVLGEAYANALLEGNVMGVTLGTGIGSGFITNGELVTESGDVPKGGDIYNVPFKNKNLEDWVSSKWFLDTYSKTFETPVTNVKAIADKAETSLKAKELFEQYGQNLGLGLASITKPFNPSTIIIGGSISKSYPLFKEAFENCFNHQPRILTTKDTANAAMLGAVAHLIKNPSTLKPKRTSEQYIMPIQLAETEPDMTYNVYPSFQLSSGSISLGIKSLAAQLPEKGTVIIDGYMGAYWEEIMASLSSALKERDILHVMHNVGAAYHDPETMEALIAPYLGGDDPLFGRIFPGTLNDLFDNQKLAQLKPDNSILSIIYGPGAALANWDGQLIYIDTPKNEIQYCARAGSVLNLGNVFVADKKQQYKRMYFIDWPLLNQHKQNLLHTIDYIVDGQFSGDISWATGQTFRDGLKEIASNAFRARPWFEPGIWGGNWMKSRIKGLPQEAPNYAWSFELIVPENGIVLSKDGARLEVSFDFLMFYNNNAILGDAAATFGTHFPIRFDYLDTVNGQNLSLQCHPTLKYIQQNFGEKFTQDETYYILDSNPGAEVYLGFKKGVEKADFHKALVKSHTEAEPLAVADYIQIHPAKKHDLFLIPNGTVHCSGKGSQVLEISSTPYIFTFKMYDWMRFDLDGKPRPLNIERGIANLNMDCKGKNVTDAYISKQEVLKTGKDWQIIKLSTHPRHFYEIHRFEFDNEMLIQLERQCHVLNLVEGTAIQVVTNDRMMEIHYAETFVVPASAGEYKIINLGGERAKVIQSNVKPEFCNIRF